MRSDGSGEIDFGEFSAPCLARIGARGRNSGTTGSGRAAPGRRAAARSPRRRWTEIRREPRNRSRRARRRDLAELRAKRRRMMLARDTGAIDIDGDGVIDEYEIALAKYPERSCAGDTTTEEPALGSGSAREAFNEPAAMRERGKRLMAEQIGEKYRGRMSPGARSEGQGRRRVRGAPRAVHALWSLAQRRTTTGKIVDMKASRQVEEALCGGTRGSPGRPSGTDLSDDFFVARGDGEPEER